MVLPKAVPSEVSKSMLLKLSAEVVFVWVMFISIPSLVDPSVGAEVEVKSSSSPVVKEAAVMAKAVWVVAPEVMAEVNRLPVRVSEVVESPKVVLPSTVRSPVTEVVLVVVVPVSIKFLP